MRLGPKEDKKKSVMERDRFLSLPVFPNVLETYFVP